MIPVHSIIIPVYNEEEVIPESYRRIKEVMDKTQSPYELIFINDGSHDLSLPILKDIQEKDDSVVIINFSRNFGHQNAITAGMDYSKGQGIIIIDADLQDPPEVMLDMIEKWKEGYDVVYGKRTSREGETPFKLFTAKMYYRFLRKMTSIEIPVDTGDFRLIDRKVCDALMDLPEKNRYVRGLVSWVGFRQTYVEYDREERFAGETKYPFNKMIKLAFDGITSFSYKPLIVAPIIGFIFIMLSFLYLTIFLINLVVGNKKTSLWSVSITALFFTQGVILIFFGLFGEYLGRIYDEVKERPNYIVDEVIES